MFPRRNSSAGPSDGETSLLCVDSSHGMSEMPGLQDENILSEEVVTDSASLLVELDRVTQLFLHQLKECRLDEATQAAHLEAFQVSLVNNILNNCERLDVWRGNKMELIQAALHHPFFQPSKVLPQLANKLKQSFYTKPVSLFVSGHHHYEPYATKAIQLLEAARDELLQSRTDFII